jgi:hypothetical protein
MLTKFGATIQDLVRQFFSIFDGLPSICPLLYVIIILARFLFATCLPFISCQLSP